MIAADGHTHVFEIATIRDDIVSAHLVERFGSRWWFQTCESCATVRLCPASAEFFNVPPEVPREWELWREKPSEYEITQMRRG